MLELGGTTIPLAEFSAEGPKRIDTSTTKFSESHLGQLAFLFQSANLTSS